MSPRPVQTPPPAEAAGERPIALAVVIGAHGVAGEVRLKLFTDDLARYRELRAGGRVLTLRAVRPGPSGAIARFSEIDERTAAEALRGTELTVARASLPPLDNGEYYHADLIDLPVQTPDGTAVGRVALVDNFGAGDVIEIERPDGRRFMAPMRPEAVPEWNADRLVIEPDFVEL